VRSGKTSNEAEMATSDGTTRLDCAGVAMAVIVAVASLGGSIGDLFDSNGRQLAGASRPRAVPATPLAFPTTVEKCVDPGRTRLRKTGCRQS